MRYFLLFTFLFATMAVGCRRNSQDLSLSVANVPITAPTENEVTATISNDQIADMLQQATTDFTDVFHDRPTGLDQREVRLDVDSSIKDKYVRDNTPVLIPQVVPEEVDDSREAYLLTYQYQPQDEMKWDVVHRIQKKISYSGYESVMETISKATRRWKFGEQTPEGRFVCEHYIDRMNLYQKDSNREAVSWDSETDTEVPDEIAFFGTDKTVGRMLERFEIEPLGVMSSKEILVREYHGLPTDSKVMVPFPPEKVAVGQSWTLPLNLFLKGRDGTIRSYQAMQKFTLSQVQGPIATISFRTLLLTVVSDPVIEGQLAEKLFTGFAKFDLNRGRMLETELDFTKSVPGAMGDASYLEYHCHLVEKLIRE